MRPAEPEAWKINAQEAHRQFPLLWGPGGKAIPGRGKAQLRRLVINAAMQGLIGNARRLLRQRSLTLSKTDPNK